VIECLSAAESITATANFSVDRSTLYRWKKQRTNIENAAQQNPLVCYGVGIRHPVLEKRLFDWIVDMRKNRSLCVSTECLLLMLANARHQG
ncbi:hypothetical protein L914_08918, partial [Phytophthora nicotianae]